MPKISIVSVCYNNKDGLKKTIDSVRNQTFKDYEFIVIDGGSQDGSKEIIEANKDLFSFWCSEPDGGIYQGMNKGIDHANGEYCLFLNSGDWLAHKEVLKNVFEKEYNEDILYGDVICVKGKKKKLYKYPDQLTFYDFYKSSAAVHHQATFFKTCLFGIYGKYAEDTYMNADWRFYFNTIVKNKVSTKHVQLLISICDATGTSNTFSKNNPKVLSDLNFKQKEIEKALPLLSVRDYEKMTTMSVSKRFWNAIKWRLSVMVPLKWIIDINK